MDLRRLRTFVVVAEQGTVSSAAKTLRITQPALSRQLQDLQAEFGVQLFDHVGRLLRLTAEGAELAPTCRNLLSQADNVLEHAHSLAQGDSGELNVGATPHTIASVFPGFLRQFAAKYPRVRVKTVEAGSVDQLELMRRGELHAAVGFLEGKETEFIAYPLPPVRLLVAYNPTGGFSFAKKVEARDLADVPLLLLVQGFGTRKSFDAACRLERIVPNVFMESSAPETLLALARESHGVAIVPSTAQIGRRSLRVSPLIFRGSQLTVDIALLWSGTRRLPRYAEAFGAMLAAHMRAVSPQFEAGDRSGHSIRRRKKMAHN
jgi:LysR family cyn operon transcriptional activator